MYNSSCMSDAICDICLVYMGVKHIFVVLAVYPGKKTFLDSESYAYFNTVC